VFRSPKHRIKWPTAWYTLYVLTTLPVDVLDAALASGAIHRIGADDSALGAHHARAERRHRDVIGPRVDIEAGRVPTVQTRHVEATHPERTHVAERHRVARL
jgi:hypothetical protein